MEQRETVTLDNPLRTVLDEMRKPQPNVGRLGEGFFALNKALIPTMVKFIEQDRQEWDRKTGGGTISTGLVGQVEVHQQAFLTLASLGKPGGQRDFTLYLLDSGYSRLTFFVDDGGQLHVEATYNSLPGVKEKFNELYSAVQQSQPSQQPKPSSFLQRIITSFRPKI